MKDPTKVRMLKRVYSVRDDKMQMFGNLTFIENDAVAIRSFSDAVSADSKSLMAMHGGDFALHFLGFFDSESGEFIVGDPIDGTEMPHIVCRASDFAVPTKE